MKMTTTADGMTLDQPARFWRRMFAGVFDIVFLMTAALVLFLEIMLAVPVATQSSWDVLNTPETAATLWTILGLVWYGTSTILLPTLYYTLTEGAYGQTLGKALFGIVVVSADGRPIGYCSRNRYRTAPPHRHPRKRSRWVTHPLGCGHCGV
jgi:uncharacterized RDD family membrane protein YckC